MERTFLAVVISGLIVLIAVASLIAVGPRTPGALLLTRPIGIDLDAARPPSTLATMNADEQVPRWLADPSGGS